MLAPPPPRLSTTICCPSAWPSRSPMDRARGSVPPPGGNGMMKRIERFGYCACAGASHARPQIEQISQTWHLEIIVLLLHMCHDGRPAAVFSGQSTLRCWVGQDGDREIGKTETENVIG